MNRSAWMVLGFNGTGVLTVEDVEGVEGAVEGVAVLVEENDEDDEDDNTAFVGIVIWCCCLPYMRTSIVSIV